MRRRSKQIHYGEPGSFGPMAEMNISSEAFQEKHRLTVDKLECHIELLITGLVAGLSAIGTGAASVAASVGLISAGTAAAVTGTTAVVVGGAVVAGGAAIIGGTVAIASNAAKASGRAAAYNEINGMLSQITESVDNSVGGISVEEQRRRAALADAKNNMTNVLSGASSESATGPVVKSTLGNTDVNTSIIGS